MSTKDCEINMNMNIHVVEQNVQTIDHWLEGKGVDMNEDNEIMEDLSFVEPPTCTRSYASAITFVNHNEGLFAILPPELRHEIFSHIDNYKSIMKAMSVNKRWRLELELALYNYCQRSGYLLEEENFWIKHGKDWKWILRARTREFIEEPMEGIGFFVSEKGRYEGEWKNKKKTGWGKMSWKNGGFYKGHWSDNTKEGFGYQKWGVGTKWEGDTYEGFWHKSNRQGHGVYIWNTGDRYEGDWKDGKKQGTGVFFFAKSGNKYEGHYEADQRNGDGSFRWANGDIYEGQWENGDKHGLGTYRWTSGEVYVGEWLHSERTGKGVFSWRNGAKYEGEWVKNRMQGTGTYTWPDKDRYEGKWCQNSRTTGTLITVSGERIPQQWFEVKRGNRTDIKNLVLRKHLGEEDTSVNQ